MKIPSLDEPGREPGRAHAAPTAVKIAAAASLLYLAAWPSQVAFPADSSLSTRVDSLRRVIERRTLSDAEKKQIRSCDRDKALFLKKLRTAEKSYAQVDRDLNEAKLRGANPNDPAVMALLEKKFTFEKGFDDQYTATPAARKCIEGENRRRLALNKALEQDQQYQHLWRKSQGLPEPL